MANNRWRGKVVVITGGSSGIGLSLAKLFARDGATLYLMARDEAKLRMATQELRLTTNTADIKIISADVSDQAQVNDAMLFIGNQSGKIDLLVNNAGTLRCGQFQDIPSEDYELLVRTNYLGAVYCTHAAWRFLKNASGQVGFVSSVAGYIGLIGYAAYAPTKFALAGLAECLRMEGKRDGIRVSIVYPGDTQTPMLEYEHKHTLPETKAINKNVKCKTPDEVADIFKQGLEARKFEIYCDRESKFYRVLKLIIPHIFYGSLDRTAEKHRSASQ